jgi:hypothetical protein
VDLPFEQRVKDHVFQTIVDLLAPLLNYGRTEPADFEPGGIENPVDPIVEVGSPIEEEAHPVQEGAPVEPQP